MHILLLFINDYSLLQFSHLCLKSKVMLSTKEPIQSELANALLPQSYGSFIPSAVSPNLLVKRHQSWVLTLGEIFHFNPTPKGIQNAAPVSPSPHENAPPNPVVIKGTKCFFSR